jgi:hypothetical protein
MGVIAAINFDAVGAAGDLPAVLCRNEGSRSGVVGHLSWDFKHELKQVCPSIWNTAVHEEGAELLHHLQRVFGVVA